jgi:hypothetical protein
MAANAQSMVTSFKQDMLNGIHAFGTSVVRAATTADAFKVALYTTNASIGAATTAYSTTGEVVGTNYVAGGIAVTNATAPTTSGTGALWTPSGNFVFTNVTLSTAFDCALVYNNSASGKNAVSSHTFGSQTVTAATFTLTMPANTTGNALLQLN